MLYIYITWVVGWSPAFPTTFALAHLVITSSPAWWSLPQHYSCQYRIHVHAMHAHGKRIMIMQSQCASAADCRAYACIHRPNPAWNCLCCSLNHFSSSKIVAPYCIECSNFSSPSLPSTTVSCPPPHVCSSYWWCHGYLQKVSCSLVDFTYWFTNIII